MIQVATRATEAEELARQKRDFTAEGAPAPGPAAATPVQKSSGRVRRLSNGPFTVPPPLPGGPGTTRYVSP